MWKGAIFATQTMTGTLEEIEGVRAASYALAFEEPECIILPGKRLPVMLRRPRRESLSVACEMLLQMLPVRPQGADLLESLVSECLLLAVFWGGVLTKIFASPGFPCVLEPGDREFLILFILGCERHPLAYVAS